MTAERALPRSVTPRGLNGVQAAEYVGVGAALFDQMVRDGRMPKPFKVNTRTLWDRQKLDAAFDALSDQGDRDSEWETFAA
jgi:predicted DNA-binding transcriptional regulator AlpA